MEIEGSKQIDDKCKSSVSGQLLPSEPSSSASIEAGSYGSYRIELHSFPS